MMSGFRAIHARQVGLDMVAGADIWALYSGFFASACFEVMGKEEVGMAVEKIVTSWRVGIAHHGWQPGGLSIRTGRPSVPSWLVIFWAVRRGHVEGCWRHGRKLEASATICSTLLGAVMLDGDVLLLLLLLLVVML